MTTRSKKCVESPKICALQERLERLKHQSLSLQIRISEAEAKLEAEYLRQSPIQVGALLRWFCGQRYRFGRVLAVSLAQGHRQSGYSYWVRVLNTKGHGIGFATVYCSQRPNIIHNLAEEVGE